MNTSRQSAADVVYQIYPKSFLDTTGSGTGDIRGIITKLDYLQQLGVTYLWLNPMFVSPQRDNGYDIADYRNFDPRYGTMADFEELVAQAAQRGIGIMMDMVFNHTSTSHEWFQKALAGEQKYQDYYLWRDGKPDGSAPTTWQSKFGGPAWEYVPQLDKWYLHLFDVTQADLNWENPQVRAELVDIINFWLAKGVRGFRFDVINLISKAEYRDAHPGEDERYLYTDGPKVHQWLQELRAATWGSRQDILTVGEMSSTKISQCSGYAGADSGELDSVFTFHHLKVDYAHGDKWELKPYQVKDLRKVLFDWQLGMQETDAWNALFWNNHDQPRALSRFGNENTWRRESALALAAALHGLRGTPYVYMGEEIGMTNAGFTSVDQYCDVESTNAAKILAEAGWEEAKIIESLAARSRDNSRIPMHWEASSMAGFTAGIPWLGVGQLDADYTVAAQLQQADGVLAGYKKLISLRKQLPVVQHGTFIPQLEDHPTVIAYRRQLADEQLVVVANFSDEASAIPAELIPAGAQRIFGNYDQSQAAAGRLAPWETGWFYLKS